MKNTMIISREAFADLGSKLHFLRHLHQVVVVEEDGTQTCIKPAASDNFEPLVVIPKSRLEQLTEADDELTALHAGGVDNWEWYGESLQQAGLFEEDEDDD